ncbi:hypothetical protein KBX37_06185 [Micromonospora sp. U56]|uniref:hypothetical protein n=1 Tax=unclassified Micromonospora TaxID=2617518 RepID=UPI001B386124|nr:MULTISPECIES: hypothetical protein [unclassified Micromonospora]MBQ0892696.1 hypothetical protein [Micromonospora sp. U56]MBQ0905492.1 hypothetical protein [Micromonospora sp. U21]
MTLTPVSASSPTSLRVTVLGPEARKSTGAKGALLALSCEADLAEAAQVHLRVYYWGFGNAYGGDYANRVGMAELPACALTDPRSRHCLNRTLLQATRSDGALAADITIPGDGSLTLVSVG